jgi:hypothetical protein
LKDTSNETSATSKYPWIYSLLEEGDLAGRSSQLPSPIEYQLSRFSNYKPNYVTESTASNANRGLIQKPSVMSVVPHGFYVGTSLYWDKDVKSALPSFMVGYADEKAVREYQSYPGLGSRLELKVARKKDEDQLERNEFSLGGEIYLPLGGGKFTGLGGSYQHIPNIPLSGVGKYDESIERLYLPVGIGFTTASGRSGRVQLNTLIGARQKAKLSQLTSWSASDVKIEYGFGDAFGLNLAYSLNVNSEFFVDYWRFGKSKPYTVSINGAEWTGRDSGQWEVETGLRYFW